MFFKYISIFCDFIRRAYNYGIKTRFIKSRLGYCGKNVNFRSTNHCPSSVLSRIYIHDNCTINSFTMISSAGSFIMKRNSGSSSGLTIITGNHHRRVGTLFIEDDKNRTLDIEKDVIVEEDVWIGANVTLLCGVTIGRGATIGACSVCVKSVPPYAIVMGNPAKVIGFNFTPEGIIEHESQLYPENERLPLSLLEKNYKKYFLDRSEEIKRFVKI